MKLKLALALLLAPLSLPAAENKKAEDAPERVEVEVDDAKLKADIDDCIRRGVNWLKGRQLPDGSFPGLGDMPVYGGGPGKSDPYIPELTALALLALLKCDVPPKDPVIEKGFKFLSKKEGITGAYYAATVLMALEAKYAPKEAIAGKDGKKRGKPKAVKVEGEDMVWAGKLTSRIIALQNRQTGGWRYTGAPNDAEGGKPGLADTSATQYALMGLKTARRMDIPVKIEVFTTAGDFLLGQQEKEGPKVIRITQQREAQPGERGEDAAGYGEDRARGFCYMKNDSNAGHRQASGAMTCAGIVGLLICRSELLDDKSLKKEERARRSAALEQGAWDGFAWISTHWSMGNVCAFQPKYEQGYYLYGLERAGVIAGLRTIGLKHDWYLEGARFWTSNMTKEGADKGLWKISNARQPVETQDTPYGLLFLRKASIRVGYEIGEEGD